MFFKKFIKNVTQRLNSEDSSVKTNPEFDKLISQLVSEAKAANDYFFGTFPLTKYPAYETIKNLSPETKADLTYYLACKLREAKIIISKKGLYYWRHDDEDCVLTTVYDNLLSGLMRMNLRFKEEELIGLLDYFHQNSSKDLRFLHFTDWPIGTTIGQFEKYIKKNGLSSTMREFINEAISWPQFDENIYIWGSDVQKAKQKLMALVFDGRNGAGSIPPCRLKEDDVIGKYINDYVDKLPDDFRERIYEVFNLALTAEGAKPKSKFIEAAKDILSRTNTSLYKSCIQKWLTFLIDAEPITTTHTSEYNGREHSWTNSVFLYDKNAILVKGLIWSLGQFHDDMTLNMVAGLAERSFKTIKGTGPTCAGVGNACIYYLANSRGLTGVSHLSRLKLKIKQNSARELIQKYIKEQSHQRGISSGELEEQSVPDFGLEFGVLEESFNDYRLKLSLSGIGKTELKWFTPEGKPQKSTPAFVSSTKKHSERLRKIKNIAKQIKKYSTAQRDRIDRSYIENREWAYPDFSKYYLNHGLVSVIARNLIWILNIDSISISAIWREGHWENTNGIEVKGVGDSTKVRLWHPILTDTSEVINWRNRLQELGIQQPMKQAYREVYLLTDAESETRSYSNRMAAHLLKQHQFNALAGLRGWKYKLLGNYDDGRDGEVAKINLPAYRITCEYWINEIYSDNAYNEAGIWDYISTDQLRFVDAFGEPVNLVDIPKIVFSEIMRDTDLFVGVCSVGNDPQWIDRGGIAQYRNYWESYSFGNLTEIAKTRKAVLEQLLPRLKIHNQAKIDDKFLRVKGKIREYKIHIGSTNILMEPNDQYLCIVPDRKNDDVAGKVFLPFEGDRGLSLIISKALLLSEDDKITDTTILSQISRKT